MELINELTITIDGVLAIRALWFGTGDAESVEMKLIMDIGFKYFKL